MSGVNDIRSNVLGFFAREGHEVVPSSPLVPRNDPSLMFIKAVEAPSLTDIKACVPYLLFNHSIGALFRNDWVFRP